MRQMLNAPAGSSSFAWLHLPISVHRSLVHLRTSWVHTTTRWRLRTWSGMRSGLTLFVSLWSPLRDFTEATRKQRRLCPLGSLVIRVIYDLLDYEDEPWDEDDEGETASDGSGEGHFEDAFDCLNIAGKQPRSVAVAVGQPVKLVDRQNRARHCTQHSLTRPKYDTPCSFAIRHCWQHLQHKALMSPATEDRSARLWVSCPCGILDISHRSREGESTPVLSC
ncbi:uncharacterized protein LAESUDRAFT_445199 [Laetiporus sulphureus 93-53]|uniref:Uncharacterized protein n=1 Tax=Laetiporus sulphureus 93-53 TaxID=1314785 RepID=A0A165C0Y1_9APHY|nr:uncharacterized protein LAESUDRAFT_445199 [Laetiporus sulphureus 93-53]KZT02003.1 hypothetical protein LAESUDRAFT_445199 [Laetiporus sulphureus 93-53]